MAVPLSLRSLRWDKDERNTRGVNRGPHEGSCEGPGRGPRWRGGVTACARTRACACTPVVSVRAPEVSVRYLGVAHAFITPALCPDLT